MDIVTRYAHTFLWLQRYDEGLLADPTTQPGGTLPTVGQARTALTHLKADLMQRGEATDLFARDRRDGLAALALLVAESAPVQKEVLIRLIVNMLAKNASGA